MNGTLLTRLLVAAVAAIGFGALTSSASAQTNYYGTIFYDKYRGAIGTSYNYRTLAAARTRAKRECRRRGGRHCRQVAWFRNACGALAVGPRGQWGSGAGQVRLAAARRQAVQRCVRYGGGCKVVAWACTNRRI